MMLFFTNKVKRESEGGGRRQRSAESKRPSIQRARLRIVLRFSFLQQGGTCYTRTRGFRTLNKSINMELLSNKSIARTMDYLNLQ
ncbi:hypothetical protein IF1G_07195 [Cordyceps javanica]|uniref:Uncharacterized protein n=1 Tax=Cordyceps javanica TaxID=43265 RepID=A0A545UXY9_9HYPO|nr:hypothetical protein IF1G_07195 [Cordyceps javanica]